MNVCGIKAPLPFLPALSMKFDIESVQPPINGAVMPRLAVATKLQVVATRVTSNQDMSAQLLRAKSGGAEAILIWPSGRSWTAVANGRAKHGHLTAPLIGGWTLSMSNFIDKRGQERQRRLDAADVHRGPDSRPRRRRSSKRTTRHTA